MLCFYTVQFILKYTLTSLKKPLIDSSLNIILEDLYAFSYSPNSNKYLSSINLSFKKKLNVTSTPHCYYIFLKFGKIILFFWANITLTVKRNLIQSCCFFFALARFSICMLFTLHNFLHFTSFLKIFITIIVIIIIIISMLI